MSGPALTDADAVLINGRAGDLLSVADRGLLYGDGLFETIALREGRPCRWSEHLARLAAGAARLGIPMPSPEVWHDEARRLTAQAGAGAGPGVLKLILTRGAGPRGYRPPARPVPTRILIASAAAGPAPAHAPPTAAGDWPAAGVAATLCTTRLGTNPALAGIKHLNRLEQVLARAEWADPAIAEGLMQDADGRLVCGTMSNLFLIRPAVRPGGRPSVGSGVRRMTLATPALTRCGVGGTVRALVLREAARLGLAVQETDLHPADLAQADGAFVTNALIGLWPLRCVDDLTFDPAALPVDLIARVLTLAFEPETDW